MLKTLIIPAIDILEGKCVRLSRGNYSQSTVYNGDPVEVARMFEDAGITRIHLVDLDGAREKHIVNHRILEKIAVKTRLVIDFGGGLRSSDDLLIAFECGADMVTGGSIAIREPELFHQWIVQFGPEKIILGADVLKGKITLEGWQEQSESEIIPFISLWKEKGIQTVISTDVEKDGMLSGPSSDLYIEILSHFPDLSLIASGGISSMADIHTLAQTEIAGVITGKAVYEGKITLNEIYQYNK